MSKLQRVGSWSSESMSIAENCILSVNNISSLTIYSLIEKVNILWRIDDFKACLYSRELHSLCK